MRKIRHLPGLLSGLLVFNGAWESLRSACKPNLQTHGNMQGLQILLRQAASSGQLLATSAGVGSLLTALQVTLGSSTAGAAAVGRRLLTQVHHARIRLSLHRRMSAFFLAHTPVLFYGSGGFGGCATILHRKSLQEAGAAHPHHRYADSHCSWDGTAAHHAAFPPTHAGGIAAGPAPGRRADGPPARAVAALAAQHGVPDSKARATGPLRALQRSACLVMGSRGTTWGL